jgi:hypothetical protein
MTGFKHLLNLRLCFWQRHAQRVLPVGCQAIALIRRGVLRGVEQRMGRQYGTQSRHDFGLSLRALFKITCEVGTIIHDQDCT